MTELKRILHVDDEDDIRFIVQITLEIARGYEIKSCASGKEAIEIARSFKPQLLLLDFMMPELDGEETWKGIAAIDGLGDIPAIFMTAKAERSNTDRLMAAGAEAVITKPFETNDIADMIDECWENRARKAASSTGTAV
ncbi:MAG: response regulator [Rhodobacteraceae bacterium]|nr:response regulator [Paracoccaceae bacterium]